MILAIKTPELLSELFVGIMLQGAELLNDMRLYPEKFAAHGWVLISKETVGKIMFDPKYGDIWEIAFGHLVLRFSFVALNKLLKNKLLSKLTRGYQVSDSISFWVSLTTVLWVKATHSLGYISLFGIHDHMNNPVPEMLAGQAVASVVLITTHYLAKYHKQISNLVVVIGQYSAERIRSISKIFQEFKNNLIVKNTLNWLVNNLSGIVLTPTLIALIIWALYSFFTFVTGPPPPP